MDDLGTLVDQSGCAMLEGRHGQGISIRPSGLIGNDGL
jgi:hypothetical protein